MALENRRHRKPSISICTDDHARLSRLAESFAERNPELADELSAELERARVVPKAQLPPDVVRMGSTLRFSSDTGENRTATLVFPGEADIADGKISILTPIGVALIGLAAGQSMDWTGRDGRTHRLTLEHVYASSDAPEGAGVSLAAS